MGLKLLYAGGFVLTAFYHICKQLEYWWFMHVYYYYYYYAEIDGVVS